MGGRIAEWHPDPRGWGIVGYFIWRRHTGGPGFVQATHSLGSHVEWRTTNVVARVMWVAFGRFSVDQFHQEVNSPLPHLANWLADGRQWGELSAASGMLSNPTSDRSAGTPQPELSGQLHGGQAGHIARREDGRGAVLRLEQLPGRGQRTSGEYGPTWISLSSTGAPPPLTLFGTPLAATGPT